MSNYKVIHEGELTAPGNEVHNKAFNNQQTLGEGFRWKQRDAQIPGFGAYVMPTWLGYPISLELTPTLYPQFAVGVRRDATVPSPVAPVQPVGVPVPKVLQNPADPKVPALPAPAVPAVAPKVPAPIKPVAPKVYARYTIRLYFQINGALDIGAGISHPIYEALIEGLEESGQQFGLREYLQTKFKIPASSVAAIKRWPNVRLAFDSGGWYNGQLPDPKQLEQFVGTGNVDTSRIGSAFAGVGQAVAMVNQFNGDLLRNIAFIFNTAGNAYGVYVPALDQAIENEKTKTLLRGKGCIVKDLPNGAFTAQPQDPAKFSPQQVQQEIDNIESNLKTQGGHAFGVNMNKVLESARQDESQLQVKTSKDFEFLAILHLGETMSHEATHAKGHQDEGAPTSTQQSFIQWALPKIDVERKQLWLSENQGADPNQYIPIQIANSMRHANWYRQLLQKLAFSDRGFPSGGASQNRFKNQSGKPPARSEGAVPSWAGMFWKGPHAAIENMLGQTMVEGEYSNKDSIEKRMRLERRKSRNEKLDPDALTTELISGDHKPTEAYSSTEKLLEDQRPKPMILSADNSLVKIAEVGSVWENVGWLQNLDLGQRERMKSGPEIDDDLATNQDEARKDDRVKSIKQGPRYNPEYPDEGGTRGMFNSLWYEPRFEPELWDNMADERTRTSPGSRFSSQNFDHARKLADFLLEAMQQVQEKIASKTFKGTRFLASTGITDAIEQYFQGFQGFRVLSFPLEGERAGVWIASDQVPDDLLQKAEDFATGKDCNEATIGIFDDITGLSQYKQQAIDEIISSAKQLCQANGFQMIYIVGGYPRSLVLGERTMEIRDLDFASPSPDECLKLGGLLAAELGADPEFLHRTLTMTWNHRGIKCDFRGKQASLIDRELFREGRIPTTALNIDIYSRDLTINMLIYNLADGKIYDVTKRSVKDIEAGVLQTYFPASASVENNPLIILRVLKYANRYRRFAIATELEQAIRQNIGRLSELDEKRRSRGISDILREGRVSGEALLKQYGIEQ